MKRSDATQQRLLEAAGSLFGEQGFRGTTMRDVAGRGGINLAAAHYHFGSKRDLYIEVLRGQFAAVRREFENRNADVSPERLQRATRRQLVELLQSRAAVMLKLMVGPPPSLHSTLMLREMSDPSEALPVIVGEFFQPMLAELVAILQRLAPKLSADGLERCAFGMMGQALFYRISMPILLQLKGQTAYPSDFVQTLAKQITTFSLGGLAAVQKSQGAGGRRAAKVGR